MRWASLAQELYYSRSLCLPGELMKDEKDPGTKDAFVLSNAERQRKFRQAKKGKAKLIYLDASADNQLKKLSNKTGMTQEQVINWLLHLAAQHDKTPKI